MESMIGEYETVQDRLPPRRGRVLVVGGDPKFQVYYREAFEELGLRPLLVSPHLAALSFLRSEIFDFIIVDQGGVAFEGRCILEHARELDLQTPILVVTRNPNLGHYALAMHLGAVGYVEDPVALPEIMRFLKLRPRPHASRWGRRDSEVCGSQNPCS
ncbi:MAG: response regulator [Acidobacteria bacterium]|nr:response regulator [Acidobacteriota bacterium]